MSTNFTDNPQGPVVFDLQLFAEGDGGAAAPVAPEATPAATSPAPAAPPINPAGDPRGTMQNPLLAANPEPAPQPQPTPQPAPPTPAPQPESLILGKFKSQDDLIKSYTEAEKKIAEQGQQLSVIQQQWDEFQGRLQQLQPSQQSQGMTPEQIQQINEQWMNGFYDNPLRAIAEVTQHLVDTRMSPVVQHYQQQQEVAVWEQQIEKAATEHGDFNVMLPEIQKVINEQGGDALAGMPNAIEVVYQMAKARQARTPDELLQDPGFRQRILQDPSIKNEILKTYATGVKAGQPPVVIGNQPSIPAAAPPNEIKTTSDAKKASINYFQKFFGSTKI